jgi:hypothetical protein
MIFVIGVLQLAGTGCTGQSHESNHPKFGIRSRFELVKSTAFLTILKERLLLASPVNSKLRVIGMGELY